MKVETPFSGSDYSFNVITENKGDKVNNHYHKKWDETWYIVRGRYEFFIDGVKVHAATGDVITAKRGVRHSVSCMMDGSQRLAVFKDGVELIYED